MKFELVVAIISGGVELASASGTIWGSARNAKLTNANAKNIEELKISNERLKVADQKKKKYLTSANHSQEPLMIYKAEFLTF